jgi:hypothetical protein
LRADWIFPIASDDVGGSSDGTLVSMGCFPIRVRGTETED